jgi:two-component system, cell cycle response regulator
MRVLIADDDPTSRKMLELMLGRASGYELMVEANGEAAYAALMSPNPPEIAVLDWMMPGKDGVDICRAVRNDPTRPYTYLILLTVKQGSSDVVKGLDAGADDYLTKPFNVNELQARLRVGERVVTLQRELLAAKATLQHQATHDALTGLLNHGAVLAQLEQTLVAARQAKQPISVVMADLDRFKSVNDFLGHLAGDAVLREAAARLGAGLGEGAALGRYGGEEMLVVLPGCDAQAAAAIVEQMRLQLSTTPVDACGTAVKVTSSFGIATVSPESQATPMMIISAADAALMQAKQAGGDRALAARAPEARPRSAPPPLPRRAPVAVA